MRRRRRKHIRALECRMKTKIEGVVLSVSFRKRSLRNKPGMVSRSLFEPEHNEA